MLCQLHLVSTLPIVMSQDKHSLKIPVYWKARSFYGYYSAYFDLYMIYSTFLPTLFFTFTASLLDNSKELTWQFPQVTFHL